MEGVEQEEGKGYIRVYRVSPVLWKGCESVWCVLWNWFEECEGIVEAPRGDSVGTEDAAWGVEARGGSGVVVSGKEGDGYGIQGYW